MNGILLFYLFTLLVSNVYVPAVPGLLRSGPSDLSVLYYPRDGLHPLD